MLEVVVASPRYRETWRRLRLLTLPRTAQTQYNAGPRLPPGATAQPGDLVFFGTGPDHVTHVGIATSATTMIDAPDFGTTVREDAIQRNLVGITRPTQSQ